LSINYYGPRNQLEWNEVHLDAFWKEIETVICCKNSDYIMLMLKDYSQLQIPKGLFRTKPYAEARQTKSIHPSRRKKRCRCCFTKANGSESSKIIIHHIIGIKNGGNDQKRNRIGICRKCHAEIHPWLKNV